jgi:excisionase family DNA binding protein
MARWMTPAEVARRAGVTPAAVRRWADSGILPFERTETGRRLFDVDDVETFLRDRESRKRGAKER